MKGGKDLHSESCLRARRLCHSATLFRMKSVPIKPGRSFASDNNAGVHPEVLEALARANQGHVVAYGDDPYTDSAVRKFEEHFGPNIDVFFTFKCTVANVLCLHAINSRSVDVLCSVLAHD